MSSASKVLLCDDFKNGRRFELQASKVASEVDYNTEIATPFHIFWAYDRRSSSNVIKFTFFTLFCISDMVMSAMTSHTHGTYAVKV